MGIKYDEETKTYTVSVSKRHPVSRVPKGIRWYTNEKGEPIKTMAEARRLHTKAIYELADKLKAHVIPKWSAVIEKYCAYSIDRGLMQSTVENYRLGLNAYTLEPWGGRLVDSITTDEIRTLIREKVAHRSINQQKNILKFIRAVFAYAVEIGAINRNPCPDMKFRAGDKIRQCLTESQVRLLLEKAKDLDSEWYEVWAVALYTGMRSGEMFALTWDKVNLEMRQIKVDCSWNNKDGFKSTKSGDDRMVEIAPALLPILKELKLKQGGDSAFVLPRLEKWEKGEQARELRMFLISLQLPRIRFHDLRATWATIMLGRGIEPIKVMYMGGWKDMKTMMIYMRKAGIEIRGITDSLRLHEHHREIAEVIKLRDSRERRE
jgi:integrase